MKNGKTERQENLDEQFSDLESTKADSGNESEHDDTKRKVSNTNEDETAQDNESEQPERTPSPIKDKLGLEEKEAKKQETKKQRTEEEPPVDDTTDELNKLKEQLTLANKKLELYEPLLTQKFAQERNQQQQTEKPKSWEENIKIEEQALADLLSGDAAKATPVLRQFAATLVEVARNAVMNDMAQRENARQYVVGFRTAFYDKYKDLKDYPEIVEAIGNRIGADNPNRQPHELLDDIGNACRNYIKTKFGGTNGGSHQANGPKQGETGRIKVPSRPKPELSETQKEMFELLED